MDSMEPLILVWMTQSTYDIRNSRALKNVLGQKQDPHKMLTVDERYLYLLMVFFMIRIGYWQDNF
jgi:hypothetical protein